MLDKSAPLGRVGVNLFLLGGRTALHFFDCNRIAGAEVQN